METPVALSLAAALVCLGSALAFSPIGNVDEWDVGRLRKAGISVAACEHPLQREDPPLEWARVSFDCTVVPDLIDAVLTARVRSNHQVVCTFLDARGATGRDTLTIVFAVREEYVPHSYVDIIVWRPDEEGTTVAGGWGGYRLSVRRILELVREKTASRVQGR